MFSVLTRGCQIRFRRLLPALILLSVVPFVLKKLMKISRSGTTVGENIPHISERYKEITRLRTDQVCVHPQLEINHSSVAHFFKNVEPLECDGEPNWVYVNNGTFKISEESRKQHGAIFCKYTPFRAKNDFQILDGQNIDPMPDGAPLKEDFFTVSCKASDGHSYVGKHSGIAYNDDLHARHKQRPLPDGAMGLSVFMLGLESVSRLTAKRKLPLTVSYFTSIMRGIELEGYNIVGDGTTANLLAILTGKTEEELPEARRGFSGAKPVDDYPWIWKDVKNKGYVTQWSEDAPYLGTFTYRLLGFTKPPVDHYMRPFYMKSSRIGNYGCFGSVRIFRNHLDWSRDAFVMYGDKRKFMFSFYGDYSHRDSNAIQHADRDILEFLRFLNEKHYLNNTIVILMSDHGSRHDKIRKTVQGKLEERLPYFGFSFPSWFEQKYPIAIKNFRTNVNRLSVAFDVHQTFLDLLDYKAIEMGEISNRGISLFREIPIERSCAHAGVQTHWCACLSWKTIGINDTGGLRAVNETVTLINSITMLFRNKCETLRLFNVTRMVKYSNNDHLLRFKKSSDLHGRKPVFSDKMSSSEIWFQVTFQTTPGFAIFEATVKHDTENKMFFPEKNKISRLNKYGEDPNCVMKEYPHLRPYCYCKTP